MPSSLFHLLCLPKPLSFKPLLYFAYEVGQEFGEGSMGLFSRESSGAATVGGRRGCLRRPTPRSGSSWLGAPLGSSARVSASDPRPNRVVQAL